MPGRIAEIGGVIFGYALLEQFITGGGWQAVGVPRQHDTKYDTSNS